MTTRAQVLITAGQLADVIAANKSVTILDVRWQLDAPDGRPAYLDGHIPGAVYVSLEDELSDQSVVGRGRHPLPSGRRLQVAARRWGITQDALVVVYDNWNRAGSGRAWWVLTAAGVGNVRILDGGLGAWRESGGNLETGPFQAAAGNVTVAHEDLYAGAMPTLTADETGDLLLFDSRAPERYRGDSEPVDAVAGHIPGARNVPFGTLLAADGTFIEDEALAQRLSASGIERGELVGAYCGSGVTASVLVAALATAGYRSALYPGSWSEWSSDPSRPIARGDA